MNINLEFDNEYLQYFQRLYEFQKTTMWVLPTNCFAATKFNIPELQQMKQQLNQVKGMLSSVDLGQWSNYTRNRDVAGYVQNYLRKKFKPELLTQAWCKFYEIVSTFVLVTQKDYEVLRTVHLCEAPGAFICALNHYLSLNYPNIQWKWIGHTLNPNYEGNPLTQMIPDDRLIRYTRRNWYFGLDLTGNIQYFCNFQDITSKINAEEKVSLVTADGSIDCMSDPGEQEKLVEYLHYCETMTALAILQKGGSFVLKIFTIFEDSTICLIYLLNCIFTKVFIFKPCTSKSGNSELYVICYEYLGFEIIAHIWDNLLAQLQRGEFDKTTSMFSMDDIPNCFYLQLLSCCSYFFIDRQIKTIKDNIYYFYNPDDSEMAVLQKLKHCVANQYIKRFKLHTIPRHKKLVPYLNVHEGKRKIDDVESITYLKKGVITMIHNTLNNFMDIKQGRQIDKIQVSKFALLQNLESLHIYLKNHEQQRSRSFYNLVLSYLEKHNVVINITNFKMDHCYRFQKQLFSVINDAISAQKNIIFINIPFSTHFMASLWCILAIGFEEVHFAAGRTIFYKPKGNLLHVKNMFNFITKCYSNNERLPFASDIVQILAPEFFDKNIEIVEILKKINKFVIPT